LAGPSPLTTSTWSGTSATPTDKESIVEDLKEDEEEKDDEEEGRAREREGGSKKDVG